MARNRQVFEEAMQSAANAAWEESWNQAIEAYQRALTEFSDDSRALAGLGEAYSSVGQLEAALEAYRQASELAPDDPVLWERIGETQEQLGQGEAAADAYLASAERYIDQQQATHLALERWQDAARACPDCIPAHASLLQYYQRHGQTQEAVEECLTLARIYQDQGQNDYALRVCQHALKLAPHDIKVMALLDNLRYGEGAAAEPAEPADVEDPFDYSVLDFQSEAETVGERGSPVESTRQRALADLAESVFDEEMLVASARATVHLSTMEIAALIGRAVDSHTRGKVEEAIAAYEGVLEAGIEQPALHFNLGLLYQEKLRFDEACAQLTRAISHPDYSLGSHFALGECYRARGNIAEALEHFIEGLRVVDLATVQRDRADDLDQLYAHLADNYIAQEGQDEALEFINSLTTFLGAEDWETKVDRARQWLDELATEGPALSLAEMLAAPDAERILESIALSQEYVGRGVFYAALEECYYALDLAPTHLLLHQQLAQVFLGMRRMDEAVAKLTTVADTYQVRGDVRQATAMYSRALKLAPMDIEMRTTLIGLLIGHGDVDQALEHYLSLADSYYQLAQMDQAYEVYQKALRLTPRGAPEQRWAVRILHKIGDIDMQRVDWKHAVEIYERIRDLAPDDAPARLMLIDLYHRFNRPRRAIGELDGLLAIYHESGESQRIVTVLEDAVDQWPDSIPLRARLAQVYLNAGRKEQALEHLDKLGDLQLEAGQREETRATIKAIIALRPPNIEDYQQLLEHLSKDSPG